MFIRSFLIAVLVATVVGTAGCKKINEAPASPVGTVTIDAIPQDMGELFAVTTAPTWPSHAQLWFQKPDKTISMVAVDMQRLKLSGTVVLIPRH